MLPTEMENAEGGCMWLGVGAEKLGGVEMPVGHLSRGVTISFLEAGG